MTTYESDPEELQQTNRQSAITNLQEAHAIIEKLVYKTHRQKDVTASSELRQLRSEVTSILSEMENSDLDTFSTKKGTLDEFYDAEKRFAQSFEKLLEAVRAAEESSDAVDTFSLDSAVETLRKNFNNRIIPTKEHLDEYKDRVIVAQEDIPELESDSDMQSDIAQDVACEEEGLEPDDDNDADTEESNGGYELDTESLSKLYHYINILEQKYSKYQPEISSNGDYIADKTWKIDLSERSIRGVIKDGMLKTPLIFETYWYPIDDMRDAVQYVQSRAGDVGKDQHKSLCLISDMWDNEIKEWAKGFIHQRMTLFLYELQSGELIFNKTLESAESSEFWHSTNLHRVALDEILNDFIDETEYFTADDVSEKFGLNSNGAKALLGELVKKGIVVDVGLGGRAKYAKAKQ